MAKICTAKSQEKIVHTGLAVVGLLVVGFLVVGFLVVGFLVVGFLVVGLLVGTAVITPVFCNGPIRTIPGWVTTAAKVKG